MESNAATLPNKGTATLVLLCALALVLRMGVYWFSPNIFWPDEIFQSLEQAHRLVFGHGLQPWEFRQGTRSWLLPGFLAGIFSATSWIGEGSGAYLFATSLSLSLLSLVSVVCAFRWSQRAFGLLGGVLAAVVCATWFEFLFFAPKALSEVIAGHVLLAGVFLAWSPEGLSSKKKLFVSGLLLGLCIALRVHLAVGVGICLLMVCKRDWQKAWKPMLAGLFVPILLVGLLDMLTWSWPFQSFWLNAYVNVVEGKSKMWGTSPWYMYLSYLSGVWSWFGLPILVLIVLGARRFPLLFFVALGIVLSHMLIPHKEYRFIYPGVMLLLVLAALGSAQILDWLRQRAVESKQAVIAAFGLAAFWLCASLVQAQSFDNAKTHITLGDRTISSHWARYQGVLKGMKALSSDKKVCGVGLMGVHWYHSGGYAYLHKDIPIVLVERFADFSKKARHFDALITKKRWFRHVQPFRPTLCGPTYCLFRRRGECTRKKGYHLNQVLKARKE